MEVLEILDLFVTVGGMVTTLDGNRVSLRCAVSGIPTPDITWTKDGLEVQTGGEYYVMESVGRNDSGNFTCSANSLAGNAFVQTKLSVLGEGREIFKETMCCR